ncbi:polymorphic toxin type 10 domain-containing protein [Leptospira santarosai]|uniref:polymorphic toxin type 10 domain-containing protein n=1 Tax=Leptospira santarosai TaxID=28183 RepID=UPI0024AF054C|nr:polymorphic toxin type 10 domain-containing protein [Leptospira santarosai]MDI7237165.1 polymorphic toxin type 10 domain-containing protein [Leptospira santarosai]
MMFLSFNLLTGAESPVSEKRNRINHVEYSKTLKYETHFLRKPPYILITSQLIPSHSKSEYDNFGRLVGSISDTDDGSRSTASYSYDASFPLSAKTTFPTGTGDPDFSSRTYTDGLGRTIYTVKSASNGGYVLTGRLVYDGNGKVVRKGQSNWATSGEMGRFVLHLEERNPTSFEYDPIGRIKKTIQPTAQGETSPTTITTTYNSAFETTEEHSSGTSKRIVKDARGQIQYVEDFGNDGSQAKIGFCYDISGNRIKKSDLNDTSTMSCPTTLVGVPTKDTSGRNQAYWSYDAFGKLRAESDPDLGVSFYTYNVFGDLTSSTNAKGVTTNLSYDSIGRILIKSIPEGNIAYTYDSLSGSENALGKLVRVEDGNQSKTFSYDKLGRVKKETRTILATSAGNPLPTETQGPYITETRYDLLGRVTRIDYPEHPISHGRMRACYEYGSAGYISGISVQVNTNGILPGYCNKDIVENISYNEFGQTSSLILGNGITTSYSYDVKGRMVRLNSSGDVGGNTKVLQDAVYSFNPNNNITNISNTTTDFNTQYDYGYDGIGRLTSANGSYLGITEGNLSRRFQQSFGYAKNGNLTSKRIHDPGNGSVQDEWSYQYTNHQVTNIDSSRTGTDTLTLQYDANGNLTRQRDNVKDLTKRISVDSQDRITQIQDGNNAILGSYWYDESGFRIRRSALEPKNNQFTNVEILYPSKFFGLEFIKSENVITSVNNVYLNGVRIAALNEAGALAYYLTDQVDSVSTVLDDEGNTLSQIQYQPYGETFVQRGDLNFSPKYNSQELDRESGFFFFNARYYDPGIGRFTSADTLIPDEHNSQGWNRFAYVYNNPIGAKDPTGHVPQDYDAGFKDASKGIAKSTVDSVKSALSAPTPVNAVVNSAVATGKGVYELAKDYKGTYEKVKDFAGKLTSKDDKVRDYAAGQAAAHTMSAVLGGAATKALGSRLPKPNVDVSGGGKVDYSSIKNPPDAGPGKDFTLSQKEAALKLNREANGGVVKSDSSGTTLTKPMKSQRGVTPDPNEWQFDHIKPKSCGGDNCSSNLQILSRQENRIKSNK